MRRTMSSVVLRDARVFHVDAEEVVGCARVLGKISGNGLGQSAMIEFEAHLRELYADVGVELALGDRIEKMVIDVGGAVRLGCGGNAFAEGIERDRDALPVDGFGDSKGVFDLHAGDESRIEASADRGMFEKAAQRAIVRESNKSGTKKGMTSLCRRARTSNAQPRGQNSFAHLERLLRQEHDVVDAS